MMSNCSLYRLRPLDPAIDPAYQDGTPPPLHRLKHVGESVAAGRARAGAAHDLDRSPRGRARARGDAGGIGVAQA